LGSRDPAAHSAPEPVVCANGVLIQDISDTIDASQPTSPRPSTGTSSL
jgi:hypothetical protein